MARMNPRSNLARAAIAVVVLLVPSSALAARAVTAGAPAPPKAGAWKMTSGGANDDEFVGTFTIGHNLSVSHLTGTIAPGGETACGTGKVSLVTSEKIFDATGTDPEGSNYNEWVVGRNEESADPVIQPVRVTLSHNGKQIKGSFDLVFTTHRGESGGDIYYDGGNCDLSFLIVRG